MRIFILSLAIILSLFTLCGESFAFTNTNTKAIYSISSLKAHKAKKTVYGIYPDNHYWAVIKKQAYTRLTKSYIHKTVKTVYPYHVKLFMRFGNAR